MKIERISFIEAKSPSTHIFSKFPIPRLGAILLATILHEIGYRVKVFIEDIARPDWSYVENSNLVCISTITSTSIRAYNIADGLKQKGIPVIMGGVHPSFLPEEALKHADYVIRGEGDITLPLLISYLEKETPHSSSITGLSYRDKSGRVVNNPPGPFIEDLDALPQPDFRLVQNWDPNNIYPISTSRGCPFNCRFCSVIEMFGRKYRFQSVGKTLEAIRKAVNLTKKSIFFVDDNFTANKKRTTEILKAMIEEKIGRRWMAQVRTDVAKDQRLTSLMAEANCHTLHIGFESINPATLRAYNKKQEVEEIINCIKVVKDCGIHIHGMFVVGADSDNLETIKRTADFAIKNRIDTVQFMILTPLPGTPFFFEIQDSDRLLHTDWSKFDGHHSVFLPAQMSPFTLNIETLKAMAKFYSWKYILGNLAKFRFFYATVGLFGKKALRKALGESIDYLEGIIPKLDKHSSKPKAG